MQIMELEHQHYIAYSFQGTSFNCRASEVDQYALGMSAGINVSGNLGIIRWGAEGAENIVLANSYYRPPIVGRNWTEFADAHQFANARLKHDPDNWIGQFSGEHVRAQLLTAVLSFLRFIDRDYPVPVPFDKQYCWVNMPNQTND